MSVVLENKEYNPSYTKVELVIIKKRKITLVKMHGLSIVGNTMIMLLTNIEVKGKESTKYIVRLYFLRWRIKEYFKVKKEYKRINKNKDTFMKE